MVLSDTIDDFHTDIQFIIVRFWTNFELLSVENVRLSGYNPVLSVIQSVAELVFKRIFVGQPSGTLNIEESIDRHVIVSVKQIKDGKILVK